MMAAASTGPVGAIANAVQRAQAAFEGTAKEFLQRTSTKKLKPDSATQDESSGGKRGAANALPESDARVLEAVRAGLGSCLAELYAGFDAAVAANAAELGARMDSLDQKAASVDCRLQKIEENGLQLCQNLQTAQAQIAATRDAVKTEIRQAISAGTIKVEADEGKIAHLTKLCEENAAKLQRFEDQASSSQSLPPGLTSQSTQGTDQQSVTSSSADIPYEQRTLAMMGQIVPHTSPIPKSQLVERANQLLQQARIPAEWIRAGPFAITRAAPGGGRLGHAVEILFCKPEQLRISKCKVRDLEIRNTAGRFLWLDARRTKSENAPARYIHKMGDVLTDYLEDNSIEVDMVKDMKKCTVANKGVVMVTLLAARPKPTWRWSTDFASSVSEQQRADFETAVGTE